MYTTCVFSITRRCEQRRRCAAQCVPNAGALDSYVFIKHRPWVLYCVIIVPIYTRILCCSAKCIDVYIYMDVPPVNYVAKTCRCIYTLVKV